MRYSVAKNPLLLIVFLLGLSFNALKAEGEKYTTKAKSSALQAGRTFGLKDGWYDYMQANASWETNDFVVEEIIDFVSIELDPNHPSEITGYNDLDFLLEIKTWDQNGNMATLSNVTLTLNPNSHTGGKKRQLHLYKFNDAHKFEVNIVSITDLNGNVAPPANMSMELGMEIKRYYYFDHTSQPSVVGHNLLDLSADPQAISGTTQSVAYSNADEIEVYWDKIVGAESYELEWTYINNYDVNSGNYHSASSIPLSNKDLDANATRIGTPNLSYRIPLIFDRGFIVYRVRGVGRLPQGKNYQSEDDLSLAIPGAWSSSSVDVQTNPNLSHFGGNYQLLSGHQLSKNWQISTEFAEDGKKKEVISYFDGTLRSRQNVTRANTLNKAIVGETFYDYQGRPAVQTLPAPALEELTYYEAFSQNSVGQAYSKDDFDVDISNCAAEAFPMGENSGAANYYSPLNPNKEAQQAYLPDADGYVFTQTEFEPDNTGRIRRQSGLGYTHRLGSDHETKYYYGTPDREELIQLFGNDVGKVNHYKKKVIIDPNGQASVTYSDLKGNTIATGLVGDAPSNLQPLPDDGSPVPSINIDMLNKDLIEDTDDTEDNNHISTDGKALDLNYTFIYPQTDDFTGNYKLQSLPAFSESCLPHNYQPVMDLSISVQDNTCSATLYSYSTAIGQTGLTESISNIAISTGLLNDLKAGSYTVQKELRVNEAAADYYAGQYVEDNTCLLTYQDFLDEAWTQYDTTDCETSDANGFYDCQACIAKLGLEADFVNILGTQYEWDQMVEDCLAPCTYISPCEAIWNAMLGDLSPGGQYAGFGVGDNDKYYSDDPLSIFNENLDPNKPNQLKNSITANWRNPVNAYEDSPGLSSSISVINGLPENNAGVINGSINPEQLKYINDFVNLWKPYWAEALITYHPEYEYYVAYCDPQEQKIAPAVISGEEYDWMLQIAETHADGQGMQYNGLPTTAIDAATYTSGSVFPILENDPFFAATTNSVLKTSMQQKLADLTDGTQTISPLNIYEYSAFIVKCGRWYGANYASCNSSYSSLTGDQQDKAWGIVKATYLSLKQQLLWENQITNAINSNYFNGAIGIQSFDMTDYLLSNGHSTTLADANAKVIAQKVSGPTSNLYEAKEKRFVFPDQNLNSNQNSFTADEVNHALYEKTGLCPRVTNLKTWLEDMMKTGQITSSTALLNVWGFSSDLYLDFTGYANVSAQNYVAFNWVPQAFTNANKTLTADIQSSSINHNGLITLNFDAASAFDWTKLGTNFTVERVRQLVPNGGTYAFVLELDIKTTATGIVTTEVLTGNINTFSLDNCASSFTGVAHTSTVADDLQQLFNLLISHSTGNKFTLTTSTDIEVAPFDSYFQNSLEPILDPAYNISPAFMWKASTSANTSYEISSSGSNKVIKIDFCAAPTGTNFTSTNTFNDVSFFRNMKPVHSSDVLPCTSINGQSPNFKIDAVYISYNGLVKTEEVVTLYGLMAQYSIDQNGGRVWTENLNTGFYDIITASEEDCSSLGNARKGLLSLFQATLVNQNSGGSFRNETNVYNIAPSPDILAEELYDQLRHKVVAYSWAPSNWIPETNIVTYVSAEVPGDEDNYIGMFYTNHGGSINNFQIIEDPNGGQFFDYSEDYVSGGVTHGYFDCEVRMEFARQGQELKFSDIGQYLSIRETSGTGSSTANRFTITVLMKDGSIETIFGSSCAVIANCYTCTAQNLDIPSNCWSDVQAYNLLTETVEGLPTYTTEEYCELNISNEELQAYSNYVNIMGISSTSSPYYFSFSKFRRLKMDFYLDNYFSYLISVTAAVSNATIAANIPSVNPPFVLLDDFAANKISLLCVSDYATYFASNGFEKSIVQFGENYDPEFPCPNIDFSTPSLDITLDEDPCITLYTNLVIHNAQSAYTRYVNQVKEDFKRRYIEHCLSEAVEEFSRLNQKGFKDYHFTLYFYDQVGNLVRTVPPAGIDVDFDPQIQTKPEHKLVTDYRYNALNQLVTQTTPDAGTSNYWYDRLGRIVASQNAKQKTKNQYGYTKYDELGRVIEIGQLTSQTLPTAMILNDRTYPSNWNVIREQVSRTFYDETELMDAENHYSFFQECLRNRISAKAYYKVLDETVDEYINQYDHASHYSYDKHGKVKTIIQDKKGRFNEASLANARFKRIDYSYDLITGNILQVTYQKEKFDQFYHQYEYDADNRIIEVYTSKDGQIWNQDLSYKYYDHGQLNRIEYGDAQVQGVDYFYTLQGWVKGMNGSTLNKVRDIGKDGLNIHSNFAPDVYSFSLNYFENDYKSIDQQGVDNLQKVTASLGNLSQKDLFNGNVTSVVNSILNNVENPIRTQISNYSYDQLNRILNVNVLHNFDNGLDRIHAFNSLDHLQITQEYQSNYSYDANGNILTLKRNGTSISTNAAMDDLVFEYYTNTNQLKRVQDVAVTGYNYPNDIEGQLANENYVYDELGNLVQDLSQNISEIKWRVDGKVLEINRNGGDSPNLHFEYDASGRRVSKIVRPQSNGDESGQDDWKITHYVRDAVGNILAVYTETYAPCTSCVGVNSDYLASLRLQEHTIFGKDRAGVEIDDRFQTYELESTGTGNSIAFKAPANFVDVPVSINYHSRENGNKTFELKNHLGNVYSTIGDYKIWKISDELEAIFYNNFKDENDLNEWESINESSALIQNEELFVGYNLSNDGIQRIVPVNNDCDYILNFSLSSKSSNIQVLLVDDLNNILLDEELFDVGSYTFKISNLQTLGSSGVSISFLSKSGPGYFTIDDIGFSSECDGSFISADVLSSNDYYPFGSVMPGRSFNSGSYRYGFNGMEKENDITGVGNVYDFGERLYDSRIGKWFSVDKVVKDHLSPYQFGSNNPIVFIDPDGNDEFYFNEEEGTWDVIPADGDHVFFLETGDGYTQLLIRIDEMSFGQATGQFFLAMLDASDLNTLSDFVAEHEDLQEYMTQRGTNEFNKKLPSILKTYNNTIKLVNVAETAVDIYTTAGESKALKKGLKKGVKAFFKKFGRKIITLCFVEGTKISTIDGEKNIEDICEGDFVYTFNEDTRQVEVNRVSQIFVNEIDKLVELRLNSGTKILTTADHLFYVVNSKQEFSNISEYQILGSWEKAESLNAKELLIDIEGVTHEIVAVRSLDTLKVKVYNFEVENSHTYYVSNDQILVHNHCKPKLQSVFQDWLTKGVHADIGPGEIIYSLNDEGKVIVSIFEQGKRNIPKKVKKAMIKDGQAALDDKEFREKMIKKIDDAIELGKGLDNDMSKRGIEKLEKIKEAVKKLDNTVD